MPTTFIAQPGGQGVLVLIANKPPAVNVDTHDHGPRRPSISDATLVRTPIASNASATGDPCGPDAASDPSSARPQPTKWPAIRSDWHPNRGRQSRTVSPGSPSRSPARRYPSRPTDNNAAPITSAT
jgi:hypothetical protein